MLYLFVKKLSKNTEKKKTMKKIEKKEVIFIYYFKFISFKSFKIYKIWKNCFPWLFYLFLFFRQLWSRLHGPWLWTAFPTITQSFRFVSHKSRVITNKFSLRCMYVCCRCTLHISLGSLKLHVVGQHDSNSIILSNFKSSIIMFKLNTYSSTFDK